MLVNLVVRKTFPGCSLNIFALFPLILWIMWNDSYSYPITKLPIKSLLMKPVKNVAINIPIRFKYGRIHFTASSTVTSAFTVLSVRFTISSCERSLLNCWVWQIMLIQIIISICPQIFSPYSQNPCRIDSRRYNVVFDIFDTE